MCKLDMVAYFTAFGVMSLTLFCVNLWHASEQEWWVSLCLVFADYLIRKNSFVLFRFEENSLKLLQCFMQLQLKHKQTSIICVSNFMKCYHKIFEHADMIKNLKFTIQCLKIIVAPLTRNLKLLVCVRVFIIEC